MKCLLFNKSSIIMVVLTLMMISCENGSDCTQVPGAIISQEVAVETFDKILVYERVQLLIQQGATQQVIVETGENLIDDIEVKVVDGRLIITNHNRCNLVRDYGLTTVTVTVPNLTEIRSSTGENVESIGVLQFPSLTLFSEDNGAGEDYHATGDFYLDLDVNSLRIVTNNLSNFYLSGQVENAYLEWYTGDGQLVAPQLIVQNAQIYHRGTHNWQLDVRERISGTILGYGDVILNSEPTVVDVQETWQGQLIYLN